MNAQLVKNPQSAIRNPQSGRGFSLTEVLLAIGTLAVGMLFIAGVFPVAIHFTTVSSERTIGASVADEAFAKIRAYGASFTSTYSGCYLYPYENGFAAPGIAVGDFSYPSTPTDVLQKRYGWSAICAFPNIAEVNTTVFVTRRTGSSGQYYARNAPPLFDLSYVGRPVAVPVYIKAPPSGRRDELLIDPLADAIEITFINDGDTIVDDATGRLYRVLERYKANPWVILLDQPWQGNDLTDAVRDYVWVVPPPVGGGRSPCIAVYQKIIRF